MIRERFDSYIRMATMVRGLLVTVTGLFFLIGCDPSSGIEDDIPLKVAVEIAPVWEDSELLESIESDSVPHVFHLLWDQSIPMGGYVHRTNPDSQDTLQKIHDLLKSARLTTDYGGGEASLKCLGITNSITSIDCESPLSRGFFVGGESRLDEGIQYVIEGLKSGAFKGAALVTDLITTTNYGIGATALLPYFKNPTIRAYYNAGELDIALLGIRIDYWGVHSGTCRTLPGPMGCWFHEGQQRYQSLGRVVKRPIYVLIIGRRGDSRDRENNPVHNLATEFAESIADLGLDVKHTTVTLGPLGSQTDFDWFPYGFSDTETGFQPVGLDPEHGYYCKDNGTYSLTGRFSDSLVTIISAETVDARGIVSVSREDDAAQINLELNCKVLREKIREDRVGVCNETSIKVRVKYKGAADWVEWSSVEHSSSLTLGLEQFIEGIYPSYYQSTIVPAPKLQECESG